MCMSGGEPPPLAHVARVSCCTSLAIVCQTSLSPSELQLTRYIVVFCRTTNINDYCFRLHETPIPKSVIAQMYGMLPPFLKAIHVPRNLIQQKSPSKP